MSVEDFFSSNGGRSAKFENVGDTIAGTITSVGEPMQRKHYETNEPLFYKDSGRPQTQLPVTVQTDRRDDDQDDGRRTLYIRGQQKAALSEALQAAGAKAPRVGDWISDRFASERPSIVNGKPGLPQKIHEIQFRKGADHDLAPRQVETPAANAGLASESRTGLPVPQGVNAGKWYGMSEQQQHDMYDALGLALPGKFFDEPPF